MRAIKKVIPNLVKTIIVMGMLSSLHASAEENVPDTSNTAFVGECSVRTDAGNFQSLGKFNLIVRDNKNDCPHQIFSLIGFHPEAKGNDIYVEYQGSNASPKILTFSGTGDNDIRLYNAQVGNHLSAVVTLNNGREAVCSGDVVKLPQ